MTTCRQTLPLLAAMSLAGMTGCLGGDDREPSDRTGGGPVETTSEAGADRTGNLTDASTEATGASGKRSDGDPRTVTGGMSTQVELSTKASLVSATPPAAYFLDPTDPEPLSDFLDALVDALRQAHEDRFTNWVYY